MGTLALRIRYLCDSAGVPRVRLSRLCGLTGSHLGLIISGHHASVRADLAAKIARTFGCSLEWLITGEGEAPKVDAVKAAIEAAQAAAATEGAA